MLWNRSGIAGTVPATSSSALPGGVRSLANLSVVVDRDDRDTPTLQETHELAVELQVNDSLVAKVLRYSANIRPTQHADNLQHRMLFLRLNKSNTSSGLIS